MCQPTAAYNNLVVGNRPAQLSPPGRPMAQSVQNGSSAVSGMHLIHLEWDSSLFGDGAPRRVFPGVATFRPPWMRARYLKPAGGPRSARFVQQSLTSETCTSPCSRAFGRFGSDLSTDGYGVQWARHSDSEASSLWPSQSQSLSYLVTRRPAEHPLFATSTPVMASPSRIRHPHAPNPNPNLAHDMRFSSARACLVGCGRIPVVGERAADVEERFRLR